MRRYLLFLLTLPLCAAPTVTVSATAQTLLGTNQTISLQVDLVDPNNTGLLRVNGTQIIPIMTASTVTPGATATVGPIYGNDVIRDGFGNLNSTYYRVRVFTVINNIISSTAAFQQFFAFTGAGTVDLATATPLAPSFMTGTSGSVSIPGTLSTVGLLTATGGLNAPGTNTFTGTTTSCNYNAVLYVGGSITCWSGSDIGAQINTAFASLPSQGGTIYVLPITGGGCYNFSTPITFTTIGKYVKLLGTSPSSNFTGNVDGGVCLNYTPTTATAAITLDWTPAAGGGYAPGAGIQDILLVNNSCHTNGGCGGSAIGVQTGGTNSGAHKALFQNVKVVGFSKGFNIAADNGLGWGMSWVNSSVNGNVTGINYLTPHENDTFVGGVVATNQSGVILNSGMSGGEFRVNWSSFDSNSTCAITITDSSMVAITNSHMENTGGGLPCYVQGGNASSRLNVTDSLFYDLVASSTTSQVWLAAGFVDVIAQFSSSGRTTTGAVVVANTRGIARIVVNAPGSFTGGVINNQGSANIGEFISNPNEFIATPILGFGEQSTPSGIASSGSDWCYGDSTGHNIRCSLNNSAFGPLVTAAPCTTSQKVESGADANVLTCAIAAQAGSYRIRWVMAISASNAATLGWTATWTDSNGNAQTPTNLPYFIANSAGPFLTQAFTGGGGNAWGYADVDVNNAGTSIVVKLTFSGTSFTAKVSATVERII